MARTGDKQSQRRDRGVEHEERDEQRRAEANEERAEELADEVAEENPDPKTRREAIEQALDAEGLSEEGEDIGQHIE